MREVTDETLGLLADAFTRKARLRGTSVRSPAMLRDLVLGVVADTILWCDGVISLDDAGEIVVT